ncbi:MAG: formylglycine-generating enzyme family protein [Defluviicoccus sp.]|nr:MAG: formylglycine-generating enzyme family protein [Defluviicoccus sp.]
MGSLENEPKRLDKEGPRHLVTLSRGFWLADTACTQALWQRVMGGNPSTFKHADRPVEQVSWDDVQRFLHVLETLLPGCTAGLPSEAEWEYACRAGTDTPFSFGAQISPDQANYDDRFFYAGGEMVVDRLETVPVKTLPPNPWGIYEMHGNILEWCADGPRAYTDAPQFDPWGDPGEGDAALRAFRGGSWRAYAGWVRSAFRIADRQGSTNDDLGFRLSLRSIEPGKTSSRPGGPARRRPEDALRRRP